MDTSAHDLEALFAQLGLDNSADAIAAFTSRNKLSFDVLLHRASFWTPSQAQFIRDAMREDSDWAETVDQLNSMLRI